MTPLLSRLENALKTLAAGSWPLTATGLLMLGALGVFAAGLWLDPRTITGAPAWLKPAKFAISMSIYTLTLAWTFTYLPEWPRVRRIGGRLTAVIVIGEVAIIALQAWRGTTSHFNVGTPLDAALFGAMGLGILLQTAASVAVVIALWRQTFADRAFGWAMRLGMTITVVGAMTGGLMTRPTSAQLESAHAGHRMTIAGAHTVGAPDGQPGLPVTGWSTGHGDLRVPHFVGLHAFQALPLLAVALRKRHLSPVAASRAIGVAGASYAAAFLLLLVQALRGQPLFAPDLPWGISYAVWFAATVIGFAVTLNAGRGPSIDAAIARTAMGRIR